MRHVIKTLCILLILFKTTTISGQENITNSNLKIELIDEDKLTNLMHPNDGVLYYVIILTTGCGGSPTAIDYVYEVKSKYKDSVDVLLLFSDKLKDTTHIKRFAAKYGLNGSLFVIDPKYKEARDHRKKGYNFRNAFCPECKPDVIGVPYSLLIRNKKILFHGYAGYKNPYPSDIVTYFLRS